MTSPTNLGFEDAGGAAGFAAGWQQTARSTAMVRAGFHRLIDAGWPDFTDPDDFDAFSAWSANNLAVPPGGADSAIAPDGSMTADLLLETVAAGIHGVYQAPTRAIVAGTKYAFGIYMKRQLRQWGALYSDIGATIIYAVFDLDTGRITEVSAGTSGWNVNASCVDVGDGWYLCRLYFTPTTSVPAVYLQPLAAASPIGAPGYVGDTTKGIYLWGAHAFSGDLSQAETFEVAWANDAYSTSMPATSTAEFDAAILTPAHGYESFEVGWSTNQSYAFTMGSTTAAQFDTGTPETVEDHEEEWSTNESYAFTMGSVSTAPIHTSQSFVQNYESYELNKAPVVFTVDPATGICTAAAHGFGDATQVRTRSDGFLPNGLSPKTDYFIVSATTNTFQLAPIAGGTPIVPTTGGSGTHEVYQTFIWTTFMG